MQEIGKTIDIEPPDTAMEPHDVDPMNGAGPQAVLKTLRDLCAALAEVSESKRFGRPGRREERHFAP